MYSPKIVERSIERIQKETGVKLKRFKIDSCVNLSESISKKWEENKELTDEEHKFIKNEQLMCSIDYNYWVRRYAKIKTKAPGPAKPYVPWESQQLLHDLMSDLEESSEERGDGILICNLKARQLGMCLDPETRVLTDNLEWVPIWKLKIGQRLVACDEGFTEEDMLEISRNGFARRKIGIKKKRSKQCVPDRKMRVSIVENKISVYEPVVKITLDNGIVIKSTSQHRFLWRKKGQGRWRSVGKMKVGDEIRFVACPWNSKNLYEDGWFSGLLDGEGCLRSKNKAGVEISVSQVAGKVLDRAKSYLINNNYCFREEVDKRKSGESSKMGNQPVYKFVINRMADIFRLVGSTNPSRFNNNWWVGKSLPGKRIGQSWCKIISMEELPSQEMMDLQTSTKTFIAEGLVSHNSTIYESALSHLGFYKYGFTGLLAADEQEQSEYLFGMMERFYENIPPFLKPERTFHVKGTQMAFRSMDTLLLVQHGRLKADVGRGKTMHGVHLSELEKWDDTDQIDDGLLPALPILPSTIVFFESTGEYRGSWWHKFCEDSMDKVNRFTMFFVPWYAEPNTYVKPAPEGWEPDHITLQHYENVVENSPMWMRGKTIRLSKNQMYFWQFTRNEYARKGKLGVFFCEYASNPKEAFRAANSSVFSYEIIEYLRSKTTYPDARQVLGPNIDHDALMIAQEDAMKTRSRRVG